MTAHPQHPQTWAPPTPTEPKKPKRIFMWIFLAIQGIFLFWLIFGITTFGDAPADDCGTLDAQTCQDAADVGTTIGIGIILALWAAVDVILGVTWAIIHWARRTS